MDVINIEADDKLKEDARQSEERATIDEYVADAAKRLKWKTELKSKNNLAASNRPDDDNHLHKLDSSLKKNTAFIRKCKMFNDNQKAGLEKEMAALNLTKYIGEVSSALVEVKLKMSDIPAMVEFCSALYQKYSEFSPNLLEIWTKVLTMKKDEKVTNPSKLRVDLRLYSELVAVGVFTLKEGLPLLGNVLTTLVAQDKENLTNISIILSFCKHCGDDYAGLIPLTYTKLAEKHRVTVPQNNLLPPTKQVSVRNILRDYYTCLSGALVALYRELSNLERSNRRQLMTRGEVSEERRDKVEKLQLEYEKLTVNTEQMADLVGEEMVEMPELDSKRDEEEEQELVHEIEPDTLGSLWEDDDTRAFYENLPDLVSIIPSILYKDSKQEAEVVVKEQGDAEKKLEEEEEEVEDDAVDEEEVEEVVLEDDEDLKDAISLSYKMVLDAFLSQLPNCVNREMIDSAAAEFCMNHNTKTNRKRLVKALFTVHRTRIDLLPFYSRLVSTLHPCMPDVSTQLAALLKQDFRWHVRKKDQINIESKIKICRFIGEMVKFKMFTKADVLFCVKQLLFDFSHHHIEMACTILETCGQFLYRSPDSHRRTKIYLEQMLRKKSAMSLDTRYVTMIENAYYLVAPPEHVAEPKKERPPLHQYLRKLIYNDLCKTNTERILRQVRKINWEDPDQASYCIKCLVNVYNVKYFNIRYVASLVAGLVQYHEAVGPRLLDDVLEDVRLGLEMNDLKYNQRRTATIRFLGELYNYRLADSSLIFKVLYSLITFGVTFDPNNPSPLDLPEHMIRLRLVCVLLDTCGQYFSSGSSKKKLDYFLIYFQRYYQFKRASPVWTDTNKFPLGVNNLIGETLTILRPKLTLYTDFEEACKAVSKAEDEFLSILREKIPGFGLEEPEKEEATGDDDGLGTIAEEEDMSLSQAQDGDMSLSQAKDGDISLSQQSAEMSQNNQSSQQSASRSRSVSQAGGRMEEDWDEDEEEEGVEPSSQEAVEVESGDEDFMVPQNPAFTPCDEDDEFLSCLDKMVNDNISDSRNLSRDKNLMTSLTAPVSTVKGKKTWDQLQEEGEGEDVQVVVMLRKGPSGKQTKGISVPAYSQLGEQLLRREEVEMKEKERVKKLTLEISERQEEEELHEALAQLQRVSHTQMRDTRRPIKLPKGTPDADLIFGSKKPPR